MNVDIHTHFIPEAYFEMVAGRWDLYGAEVVNDKAVGKRLVYRQGYSFPLTPEFYNADALIRSMDARKIDVSVLSASPTAFHYWSDPRLALGVARTINDSLASLAKEHPTRFVVMATVPLQDVNLAIGELERSVRDLGMSGLEIGTSVEGKRLDEPEFIPFFRAAVELDVTIFLHPYYVGDKAGMGRYYLTNLIGNPLDTSLAIAELIFGGVLEKLPELRLVFAHGGGFVPYQRGRLEHGYKVRPEPKAAVSRPPSEFLSLLYFDTITHYSPALEYLIQTVGSDHVLMGSDHPFDMADNDPVSRILGLNVKEEVKAQVLGRNASRLFKLVM